MCEQQEIRSFAFMDIEATGLPQYNFGKVNITEISIHACLRRDLLWSENGRVPRNIHKLTLCFNPLKMIDPQASEISGLYNDVLEPENVFNKNAANIIINFFQHLQHPVCLVAHNGFGFDFPILKKSLEKVNVEIPEYILCVDSFAAFRRIGEIQTAREMLSNFDVEENLRKNSDGKNDATANCRENEEIKKENEDSKDENQHPENKNEEANPENESDVVCQQFLQNEYKEILLAENTVDIIKADEKIDWQKLNETTPKRASKILGKKENFNNATTPKSELNAKPHEFKSRRELFTPSSSKTPLNTKSSPYTLKKRGYYKLSSIYQRIFGAKPNVLHHADDDVCTLQKIVLAYGEDFVQYADENAIEFLNVSSDGFR